jgi:hypothetical protein
VDEEQSWEKAMEDRSYPYLCDIFPNIAAFCFIVYRLLAQTLINKHHPAMGFLAFSLDLASGSATLTTRNPNDNYY